MRYKILYTFAILGVRISFLPHFLSGKMNKGNTKLFDDEAFETLYEEFFERVVIFCRSYIRNEEASKEITQDVFLKLYEIKDTLPKDVNLVSYILSMSRNRCLDYIKHAKIKLRHSEKTQREYAYLQANQHALEDSSINLIIENDIRNALQIAIGNLPPRSREIFIKNRFEGKKYREIAEELGISEKTVEFHMSKAIARLRKDLSHHYIPFVALAHILGLYS